MAVLQPAIPDIRRDASTFVFVGFLPDQRRQPGAGHDVLVAAERGGPQFYRLDPEVPGGFGEGSILDTTTHPPVVHRLHLEFQGWDGDDVIQSFPCFLVSQRLGTALVDAKLTGFDLDEVEISVDEQFEAFFPERAVSLPRWVWLKVWGTPWASDLWLNELAQLHVSMDALVVLQRFALSHCELSEV